jgi:hypothetical protein
LLLVIANVSKLILIRQNIGGKPTGTATDFYRRWQVSPCHASPDAPVANAKLFRYNFDPKELIARQVRRLVVIFVTHGMSIPDLLQSQAFPLDN